ncbi:hypothetical protein GGR55DRAFT_331074 [Xylaria sp. FL0064]|nr:hypothetical protein GGR55DRAFT_331074 [Xylaria sp. FL0064]
MLFSSFEVSHHNHLESFSPATDLPEHKLNRVHEWEHESSDKVLVGASTSAQLISRHRCEVLAEHCDDMFNQYRFASHLFDNDIPLVPKSSTCVLCRLLAQLLMMTNMRFKPSHFAVYTVNLLGKRERLAADIIRPKIT